MLEICFIQILLRTSKYSQGVKTRPLNNLKCDIQHNFLGEKILIFTGIFQDFILCNIISLLCFISKCKNMREISNRRIDTRPLINSFTFASLKDFLLFFFLFLVMIPTLPQFVYIFLIGLLYFGWIATQQNLKKYMNCSGNYSSTRKYGWVFGEMETCKLLQ